MTTPAERAKETLEMCSEMKQTYFVKRVAASIRDILASLESVQRDAEGIAEAMLESHTGTSIRVKGRDVVERVPCVCPACTVARNYTK